MQALCANLRARLCSIITAQTTARHAGGHSTLPFLIPGAAGDTDMAHTAACGSGGSSSGSGNGSGGSGLHASMMLSLCALLLEHAGGMCMRAQALASAPAAAADTRARTDAAGQDSRMQVQVQALLQEASAVLADALAVYQLQPGWRMHAPAAPGPDAAACGAQCKEHADTADVDASVADAAGAWGVSAGQRAALHEQRVQMLRLCMHVATRLHAHDAVLEHMAALHAAMAAWARCGGGDHAVLQHAAGGQQHNGEGQVCMHDDAACIHMLHGGDGVLLPPEVLLMGMQVGGHAGGGPRECQCLVMMGRLRLSYLHLDVTHLSRDGLECPDVACVAWSACHAPAQPMALPQHVHAPMFQDTWSAHGCTANQHARLPIHQASCTRVTHCAAVPVGACRCWAAGGCSRSVLRCHAAAWRQLYRCT